MHKFLEDCGKGWVLGNVLGAPIATIVMLWLHKYRFAGLFAVCTIFAFLAWWNMGLGAGYRAAINKIK